jgi:ubiquinol-cytochrome c reductase cytochrome b subunit
MLMKLGACHVESPYIQLGQICTGLYFSYFLLIMLLVSLSENTLTYFNLSSNYDKYKDLEKKVSVNKLGY